MTNQDLHDLTAAYALDALDDDERAAYQAHLRECDDCRAELAALDDTVGALAYATEGPVPPPELRDRIVTAARAEPPKVVALRPRRARIYAGIGVAAAACAGLAIALSLGLSGGGGRTLALAVQPSGSAQLTASGFDRAPSGKVYEIWLIRGGKTEPAGVFRGGESYVTDIGKLPKGTFAAVTLERAPNGTQSPTSAILEQTQPV
jgi:anti-sigma-K factor RskA